MPKSFKNTKSKDEAIAKANETSNIFDGLKENNVGSSIRSNLLSVAPEERGNPILDDYEIFGQHYDYKNFKSCSDYIREYTINENFNVFGRECMRLITEGEEDIYQPAWISTDSEGEYLFPNLSHLAFKGLDDGTFAPAPEYKGDAQFERPVFPTEGIGDNKPHDGKEQRSGFEESSEYDFNPDQLFGDFSDHMTGCDEAYKQFENTYKGVEANLNEIVAMIIKKPSELNLTQKASGSKKTTELKEVELKC